MCLWFAAITAGNAINIVLINDNYILIQQMSESFPVILLSHI